MHLASEEAFRACAFGAEAGPRALAYATVTKDL